MAQYQDYHSTDHNRINYAELEQSRMGSKAILIVLALMALGVVAMFVFGDIQNTTAIDPSATGALETTPAPVTPPVTPPAPTAQ